MNVDWRSDLLVWGLYVNIMFKIKRYYWSKTSILNEKKSMFTSLLWQIQGIHLYWAFLHQYKLTYEILKPIKTSKKQATEQCFYLVDTLFPLFVKAVFFALPNNVFFLKVLFYSNNGMESSVLIHVVSIWTFILIFIY